MGGLRRRALQHDPQQGIGLRNIRERMAAVGGSVEFRAGQGTQLDAQLAARPWPLRNGMSPATARANPGAPARALLLVDDHPMVREGLRARLDHVPQFSVVDEAGSAAEALQCLARQAIDLVLMDIGMKPVNGIELTAEVLAAGRA
jgi:hypothetical protein